MDHKKIIQEYIDQGFNIITPSITLAGLDEHYEATIETIMLSADPSYGDFYPDGGKGFRISKVGLDKLAILAGVAWHKEKGSIRLDDKKDRMYVAYSAMAAIKKANGRVVAVQATYDLDLIAEQEDLEYSYRAKGSKGQYAKKGAELDDYVTHCVGRDMRQKMKHRAALCESGAKTRVLRALLGPKKSYTVAELKKPFVCVSIDDKIDHDDPEIKRLVAEKYIGAKNNIYGSQPALTIPHVEADFKDPTIIPPSDEREEGDVIDSEEGSIDTEPNGVDEEPPDAGDDDFENWDRGSKNKHIENLARVKGYDLKDQVLKRMDKQLDDLNDVQLGSLKSKLDKMEDNDIPF